MKKFLRILAIVLFVVGLGLAAVTALHYYNVVSPAISMTNGEMLALLEAKAEGDADRIELHSDFVKSALAHETEVKQTFTMFAAGSIVSIIIGVVLWFVSRKKKEGTEKEMMPEAGQPPKPPDQPLARETWPAAFYGRCYGLLWGRKVKLRSTVVSGLSEPAVLRAAHPIYSFKNHRYNFGEGPILSREPILSPLSGGGYRLCWQFRGQSFSPMAVVLGGGRVPEKESKYL